MQKRGSTGGTRFCDELRGLPLPPSSIREEDEGKNHFQTDRTLEALVTYFICPFCK